MSPPERAATLPIFRVDFSQTVDKEKCRKNEAPEKTV
jgi:hypothetical protein